MLIAWGALTVVIAAAGAGLRTFGPGNGEALFAPATDGARRARATASAFLRVFDRLYSAGVTRGTEFPLDRSLWVGILLAPAVVFVLRVGTWAVGRSSPDKLFLLAIAIGVAFAYAAVLWLWSMLPRRLKNMDVASAVLFVVVPLVGLPAAFVGIGVGDGLSAWRLVLVALVVLYVNGLVWLMAVLVAPFRGSDGFRHFPIHPGKAMVTSLFLTAVVGLIQWDATEAFFDTIRASGLIALVFIGYSLFADSISLIETRWVLAHGADARLRTLLGLLALDLALSATIFVLPTTIWELPTFWNAIVFSGDRPWLGILFWTTFSTSVLFYAFLLSALLARPVARAARALRIPLDASRDPVGAVTAALVVLVTLGFLLGAGGTALLTAVL